MDQAHKKTAKDDGNIPNLPMKTPKESISNLLKDSKKTWQKGNVDLINLSSTPKAVDLYEALHENKSKYGLDLQLPVSYPKEKQKRCPPPTLAECNEFLVEHISIKVAKKAKREAVKLVKQGKMKPIDTFFNYKDVV